MNRSIRLLPTTCWLFLMISSLCHSQQMPQDYWKAYEPGVAPATGEYFLGCDHDSNGLIYVGIELGNGNQTVGVFDQNLSELRRWGTFTNLRGIAVNSSNEIHVLDFSATNKVQVYDTNGTLIRQWGLAGSGGGEIAGTFSASYGVGDNYSLLGVASDDSVYVLDADNYRVQIFTSTGVFVRAFGSQGDLLSQFSDKPTAMAVYDDGRVCVFSDWKRSGDIVNRLTLFSSDGVVLKNSSRGNVDSMEVASDDLLIVTDGRELQIYDGDLTYLGSNIVNEKFGSRTRGVTSLDSGHLFAIRGSVADKAMRQYLTVDTPQNPSPIPQPYVKNLSQRDGTTLVDIDYVVVDTNSATVNTAMVIYTGAPSLATLLLPETLADGTEANLGAGKATNTVHRVTWNAGVDWDTDVGTIKVEILAKDERGLFPIHWTTIPGQGGNPDIQISDDPVTNADLYSLWVWLIATRDAAVSLVSGQVIGVGGSYDGVTLHDGTNTTAQGRIFLLGRLNVEPYSGEIVKKLP